MSEREPLLERLREIVCAGQLLTEENDVVGYRLDGRGKGGGTPLAVVRPSDADQISALTRLAAETAIRLVLQGARTGLAGAGLASEDSDSIIVNLDRLSQTILIDAANRTATVDAGVRLSALNAAAAEHDLFYPIDLGADPSIGGMVATNTGGARLLRYGDVRASVLALDIVCADHAGTQMSLGAPLWKNNTGLDLTQLMVGSGGSTGIITRATVALQPRPALQMTALVALRRPEAALDLLLALEASVGTLLTAFEGMSGQALTAAFHHVSSLRRPFAVHPDYAVLVELSAGAAFEATFLEEQLAAIIAPMMEGDDAPVLDVAIDHRDALWAIRHAVPEGLRAAGTVVACDIALRRGNVMRFRAELTVRLAAEVPELVPHDFGHIGDGGLHFNLVWPNGAGAPDQAAITRARDIIFDTAVRDYGGSFSAEHGVGPRNIDQYHRFVPREIRLRAGAVQRAFAPVPMGRVDFGIMER